MHVSEALRPPPIKPQTDTRLKPASLICPVSPHSVRGGTPPACDQSTGGDTRWRLQYDVYQYFLPENDQSESSLFSSIQAMADVQGIMKNGNQVGALRT